MPDPFGLFVNRVNELMNFMELVHDDSATVSKTRYFHGEVGIGKTFLLDFLRNKLCYFQDWNFLKNKAQLAVGPELLRVLTIEDFDKGSPKKLPVAYLDFSSAPSSTLTPQSTLPALLSLQHQLAEDGLRFPHFVYASMLFLVRNGEAGKELWNKGLPNDEMNLAQQTLSAISGEEVPFANLARAMIKVTEKIFGAKIGEKLRERKMDPDELKGLHRLDSRKPSLIEDELPRLFAKDLRHALTNSAHLRVLLFFDSHDAFWGVGEREISEYLFHARDEWFRRLLIHLKPEKKILVLIAGEEPPAWDQALVHPIRKADVELVPVGGIAEQDAHSYLSAAGVDSWLVDAMLNFVRMDDAISEIHPGLLSSVAALLPQDPKSHTDREVWAKTEAERTTEVQKLRAVLLKYADQNMTKTLMAVSACLDFDYQIYEMLGGALGFTASPEQFEKLLRFPFVREEVHEDPKKRRFRVVGVLPILLKHEQPPLYLQAQQWLSKWYYNES